MLCYSESASVLMSLESCECIHVLCDVPAAIVDFADPVSICRIKDAVKMGLTYISNKNLTKKILETMYFGTKKSST